MIVLVTMIFRILVIVLIRPPFCFSSSCSPSSYCMWLFAFVVLSYYISGRHFFIQADIRLYLYWLFFLSVFFFLFALLLLLLLFLIFFLICRHLLRNGSQACGTGLRWESAPPSPPPTAPESLNQQTENGFPYFGCAPEIVKKWMICLIVFVLNSCSIFYSLWDHFATPLWIQVFIDIWNAFLFTSISLDVHFESILCSKSGPGDTLTRKGRPSMLDNSHVKMQLFDPVVVAGGSTWHPLEHIPFYN